MRLYDAGCRVEKRVRQVQRTRGHFAVVMEQVGRRNVLVAQLQPASGFSRIPHLYDAALLGTSGSSWVLNGHERIEAGPMRKECLVGQTWLVEPAYEDDLIAVENRWTQAVRDCHELREQLAALASVASPAPCRPDDKTSTSCDALRDPNEGRA